VDTNFLKAHAERCRSLARNADEYTKRRLLDLAMNYDKQVKAAGPSAATRAHRAAPYRRDAETNLSPAPGWKIGYRFATVSQQQPAKTLNTAGTKMVAVWKSDTLNQPCLPEFL
jgi:hypothetical protein